MPGQSASSVVPGKVIHSSHRQKSSSINSNHSDSNQKDEHFLDEELDVTAGASTALSFKLRNATFTKEFLLVFSENLPRMRSELGGETSFLPKIAIGPFWHEPAYIKNTGNNLFKEDISAVLSRSSVAMYSTYGSDQSVYFGL